jgi:hypothetical protein
MNDQDPRLVLHSMKQSQGMQPRGAIEFIASIAEGEKWRDLYDEHGKPIQSFTQFLEAPYPNGCGLQVEHVRKLIQVPVLGEDVSAEARQKWNARRAVIRDAMTPALNKHGVKGKSGDSPLTSNTAAHALARLKRDAPDLAEKVIHGDVSAEAREKWDARRAVIRDAMTPALNPNGVKGKPLDSNSLRRGESAAYALARLKRDAPDLAEKVIHGDVSANAAAVEAGFRNKRVSVRVHNAQSAANTLLKHMPDDVLVDLVNILAEELRA